MKWCPNCGEQLTKDGFCNKCGSSSVMPGIKHNKEKQMTKKTQNEEKKKKVIIKESKYCRICGKKLNKKGICKECESSTFMPGVSEREKYKFCAYCGQKLDEEGLCKNCNVKDNIDSNEISLESSISGILSVFSIIIFFSPLILRLNTVIIPVIIAFVLVIIAKILDHKNSVTTAVMSIEIVLIIIMIIVGLIFERMVDSCRGLNN